MVIFYLDFELLLMVENDVTDYICNFHPFRKRIQGERQREKEKGKQTDEKGERE